MAVIDIDIGTFALDSTNNIAVSELNLEVAKALAPKDLVKSHGSVIPAAKRKSYSVRIQGTVKGSTYTDMRTKLDALFAALEVDAEQKFSLDDERYLMAQYSGLAWGFVGNSPRLARFSFMVTASDPFWYAETASFDSRNPTSTVGYNVTNGGNAPTRVKVTITNNSGGAIADNIRFENVTTGERFEWGGSLANTKALIVNNRYDVEEKTVLNDGADAMAYHYGDFITLDPGVNQMKYTGATTVQVRLDWRNAWM